MSAFPETAPSPRFDAAHTFKGWLATERRAFAATWLPGSVGAEWAHERDVVAAVVPTIEFDATALPIDDLVFEGMTDVVALSVRMLVPDRDVAGEVAWIAVWRSVACPWVVIRSNGPDYLVRWMRETIANVLAHEAEESITLAGERVFDPHRPLRALAAIHGPIGKLDQLGRVAS